MKFWKVNFRYYELALGMLLGLVFLFSGYLPSLLSALLCFLIAIFMACLWVRKYIHASFLQSLKFLAFNSLSWESLIVLLFLFFLLVIPRLNQYRNSTISISGLSDSIRPSEFSELNLSDKVVFKVFSKSGDWLAKDFENLYWRVKTLERLKNFDWFDSANLPKNEMDEQSIQEKVKASFQKSLQLKPTIRKYDVLLESSLTSRQAVILDEKSQVDSSASSLRYFWMDQAELWLLKYDLKRVFYEVSSLKNISWDFEAQSTIEKDVAFQNYFKENRLYRFKEWLDKNFSKKSSPDQVLQIFQKYIQENSFSYSLMLKQSSANVEEFLLDHREGLCEHYASSLAIILKALGHSVRVVVGYQGGRWNQLGGFLEVQEKDAHAWVEYWDRSRLQWVRVDPTSWVANIQSRRELISGKLGANQLKSELWKKDLEGVLQVMGARFNQLLDYPFIKDLVQNLFDYSDAMRRNRELYFQFLWLILGGVCVFLYLRFRSKEDLYLRKFRKVEKSLIAKDKNLKKQDYESFTEWTQRCSQHLPDQKNELQSLGRELSYGAYHPIRRSFWFLRT